jgi:hypothetical protein
MHSMVDERATITFLGQRLNVLPAQGNTLGPKAKGNIYPAQRANHFQHIMGAFGPLSATGSASAVMRQTLAKPVAH